MGYKDIFILPINPPINNVALVPAIHSSRLRNANPFFTYPTPTPRVPPHFTLGTPNAYVLLIWTNDELVLKFFFKFG